MKSTFSNLLKRLEIAEARTTTIPVTLGMGDGSVRTISGSMPHFDLFSELAFERAAAIMENRLPPKTPLDLELDWLAESVEVKSEPCGQLFEMVRGVLVGAYLARGGGSN